VPYLHDLSPPAPHDSGESKLLADVQEYGWHVLGVSPDPGETGPPFAYSIGLYYTLGHPEIVVTGLAPEVSQRLINVVGERSRSETPVLPGRRYADIAEGYDVAFRTVPRALYEDYLGYALWFYRQLAGDFPVFQLIWPDKAGRFPEEIGFEPTLQAWQFLLGGVA